MTDFDDDIDPTEEDEEIEKLTVAEQIAAQNRESVERRRRVEELIDEKRNREFTDEYHFDDFDLDE
ncbi:MAG: hypothetical protein SVC26_00985 [Pseudomonadota bacterium]|nr:hypothetical protein [Pseudomonadota bacterium]